MTPLERAARDRVSAFLSHPRVRRDVEPGDPADVIAVITGRLDMPRLYKSDLRLLLAALDRHDAEALPVTGPHQITMRLASDGFPFPYDTRHPAACDLLRYGQHCQFDQLLDEGHAFPDAPGVYTARIVLAREPEPGDVYSEEPEIHYERIGDA